MPRIGQKCVRTWDAAKVDLLGEEGGDDDGQQEPDEDVDHLEDQDDRQEGEGEEARRSPCLKILVRDIRSLEEDRVAVDAESGLLLERGREQADQVALDDGGGLQGDPRADADDGIADFAADGDRPAHGDDALADLAFDDDVAAEGDDVVARLVRRRRRSCPLADLVARRSGLRRGAGGRGRPGSGRG